MEDGSDREKLRGCGGVGKTSIATCFRQNSFANSEYDPTIQDSYERQVEVDGQQVLLEIFDTPRTDQFTALRDLHMANADGFIMVYSITMKSTFGGLLDLREDILQVQERDQVPMVVVGNKCDAEDRRAVSRDEAQRLVDEWGSLVSFFETSAVQGLRVNEAFNDLVRLVLIAPSRSREGNSSDKASSRCTLC